LHVARESLKLSLSFKAYSDDHFAEAVRAIRDVWTQRILREEEAGRKAEAKRRWGEWKLARKQVLDEIAAHNIRFGTDSREYARAQFMLMEMIGTPGKEPAYTAPPAYELPAMTGGLLSETDEIYLATHKGSYDRKKAIDMIIRASAKGLLKELKQDALMGKRREGVQLRPGFHLDAIVSVEYASLIHQDTGWTDATRLGRQLYVSLMDDDLANLKAAKELLVDSGMGPTLQKQVIQEYLTYAKRTEEPGTTEIEKFLHYIKRTYGETATYFELLESLSPATTPNERLSRAEQMDLANQDGLFMTGLMEFYDWASGEDTREIAKEQLNQLRRIARSHPADLEWLLEQTGAHSVDELSRLGYGYYREAIAEVAALRATVTEACATAVEIAVEAALALATGGAAAGALVASLISAASGNLVREAVLDKEYDYFSKENVTSMVTTVATTIVSGVVGKGMDSLLAPGPWQRIELQGQFDKLWDAEVKLSKRAQFLKGMVDKAATTATSTMLSATPVAEGQLAGLVLKTVVTSAHGTGLGIWNAEKTALAEGLYQKVFLPGFKKSIATAITGKLVDWSTSNMGDKTIEQLAREMGSVTVGAFKGAVVATFGAQGKQWWDEWHKKQAELRELQAQDRERLKALEQQAILEAVQRQNAANREAEPFLTAKGGGELNAWYKQQSKEPAARLQEQISRYRQKVAYYENAVKNPVSAHDRWAKLDAGQREFLLKQRWPADRERNWRMLKVLEGIARERLGH
ncbi:MAG TPA: hypothetical protein VNT75_29695, partial [Symbiobacteriaceae bacterium]|nr:hypothetical protein [Symbiobacteriaceae bacterium]